MTAALKTEMGVSRAGAGLVGDQAYHLLVAAREWLYDYWTTVAWQTDPAYIQDVLDGLSNDLIIRRIEITYSGGWSQFVSDCG